MNKPQTTLRRKFLSAMIVFVQVVSAVGAATIATIKPPALEPLVGAPEKASAHNLQMEISLIALDPTSRPLFDARLAAQQPLIQAGDTITIVFGGFNFIGTEDGLGGYFDFYPLTGTQVVNAEYVTPVPGGYAPIPIKKSPGFGTVIGTNDPTGQLKNFSLGPNINGVTSMPSSVANTNLGTLYGFYGDTGIFYSTDPRTAQGSFPTPGNIVNNRGDDVDNEDTTGAPVPVTRFDIEQLRALGMSDPADCIFDSACRGSSPWGLGSPVAGPQSGYQWSFRITNTLTSGTQPFSIETGPFQRIQYPGSQISNDTPGNTSGAVFDTSKDASNVGFALSPSNPLPATNSWSDTTSTKLVRFAVGRIVNGTPESVRVAIKINSTSAILDAQGCPLINAMAFSGDAGINSGGKDHLWRYFNPTLATLNPCLVLFKEPSKTALATNEVFTYSLRAFNTGPITLTNVTIKDQLPAGLQYISAVPAPTAAGNPQTWNIGTLAPNKGWSAVLTVRALTPGIQVNNLTLTSDQGGAQTQAIVGVAVPIMSETKSVAPTTAAPGGTVTYTIKLKNSGTGNSSVPIKLYETLPPGFTFTSLNSVTVNGATVTGSSTAIAAGTKVTISLPATSFVLPNNEAVVVFTAQVGPFVLAGSYCNSFNTTYGTSLSQVANTACVIVGGAAIGDTVYRDWNGNGVQDPGEEGIPGAVVQLQPPSGPAITFTTNLSGQYAFNGLSAGSYIVTVISGVTGYTATQGSGGYTQVLTSSQIFRDADFGFTPAGTGSIGDLVFKDVGNDGSFNAGTDTGIAAITVWLYEDTNGNGAIDAGDAKIMTTTTGAGGLYAFTNLATGLNYLVDVDEADPQLAAAFSPNAFVASTPALQPVSNLSGAYVNADFGYFENLPSSIGDQVFIDANSNGVYDAGEQSLPAIRVNLYQDLNGNGVVDDNEPLLDTTQSSPTGTYTFGNLGPGDYIVEVDTTDEDLPGGFWPAKPFYAIDLPVNTNLTTVDFPFVPLISKQVNKAFANAGETLVYTVTATYPGPFGLTNAYIQDLIPLGTTYVAGSANAGGVYSSTTNAIVWGLGDNTQAIPGQTAPIGMALCPAPAVIITATLDTFIEQDNPTNFFGTDNKLSTNPGATKQRASLLYFPVSNTVPATATITSARLFVTSENAKNNHVATLRSMITLWTEGTSAANGATWNDSNGTGTAGDWVNGAFGSQDYGPATYGTLKPAGGNKYVSSDITQLVQEWLNNNRGIGMIPTGTDTGDADWSSRENTNTPSRKPYVRVQYLVPTVGGCGGTSIIGSVADTYIDQNSPTQNNGANAKMDTQPASAGNVRHSLVQFDTSVLPPGAIITSAVLSLTVTDQRANNHFDQVRRMNTAWAESGATWNTRNGINTWAGGAYGPGDYGITVYGIITPSVQQVYTVGVTSAVNDWVNNGVPNNGFVLLSTGSDNNNARYATKENGTPASRPALIVQWYLPPAATAPVRTQVNASPLLRVGPAGIVNVTMQISSAGTVTNMVPPANLQLFTTNGVTATKASGPMPTGPITISNSIAIFTYSYVVTPSTLPGTINFTGKPTSTNFPFANGTSGGLIIAPPLTFTAQVNTPITQPLVSNVATIGDDNVLSELPSEPAETALSASIGDRVWLDLDRDGVQDAGEVGVGGVVVSVISPTGQIFTATTDAFGTYTVFGLRAGTYTVTYDLSTLPAGYAPTTLITQTAAITSVQQYVNADFGVKPPGSGAIGDTVWLDADNDGIKDAGESGLPGIEVKLYADVNNSGSIDAGDVVITSTTTDATGYYTFTNLYGGPYLVQVNTSSTVTSSIYGINNGVTSTLGAAMTPTVGTSITRAVALATNSTITDTIDFGFNWSGYIGDYGWYDSNANGIQDDPGDEGGAPNMVVELVYDANNNGAYDPGEPLLVYTGPNNTGTGSSGFYSFNNLPPGNYIVEGEAQAIPAPASTGPLSGAIGVMINTTPYEIEFSLSPGQAITTFDFGFAAGAYVEGHIFYDENSNGVRDILVEPTGFGGIVVTLTGIISGSNTPVVLTTTTTASGEYEFPPVLPGTFTVTYNTAAPALANFPLQTTPASQTFDLIYAQEKVVDFGRDYSGAIGDTVWLDNNGNASQNPGEPGIAGATVLLYQNGVLVDAKPTSVTGTYLFTGLPAGTFTVTVLNSTIPPSYTIQTTPVVTTVNLIINTAVLTADFGFRSSTPVFTVTGRVVSDTTGTIGVVDPGDLGLKPNVQVQLVYTPTGGSPITVMAPVDANGNYTVTGILGGSNVAISVVPATVPPGYTPGATPTLTINNIVANTPDQNFGYVFAPASLAGTVVIGDGDGIAETPAEAAVSGVTITLLYAGPDGIFGFGGDDQIFTTTTNASGQYSFTNLLPGAYVVNETVPAGYNALADRDGGQLTQIGASLVISQNLTGQDFELEIIPADLIVTKSDSSDPIVAGNRLTYTLQITNAGPGVSYNTVVSDSLPAGASYVSASPAPGNTNPITWALGTLGVNATRTLTVVVDVNLLFSGTLTNTAAITSSTPDITRTNNTATETTFVTPGVGDITGTVFIDLNGNGSIDPGESGLDNITVLITDAKGLTRTVTTDANGIYTATNVSIGTATVDVVNPPAGYVQTAGTDTSTVIVPPASTANAGIDGYQPRADLRINKTNNLTQVVPGELVTYTIVVTNSGPSAATGARITDTVPVTLQNAGWACVAGAGAACPLPSSGTGSLNNLSVTLAVNSVLTFTLSSTVMQTATGSIANTAVVTTPPGMTDPTPGNNTSTDTDPLVPQADLQINKTNNLTAVVPGDPMTYTIVVTNAGPSAVTGARITDTAPVTLANASWACVAGPGTVCGTTSGFGDIAGVSVTMGARTVLTFVMTGTVVATATGNITNTTVVAPPPGVTDPNPNNNSDSDNDPLTPFVNLGIFKTDGQTTAVPGTRITYTIVVSNAGPSGATGVVISDALPAALLSPAWSCAGGSGGTCNAPTSGNGNLSTTVNLLPGTRVTFTVVATVSLSATGLLTNTASLTPPPGVTNTNPVTQSTDVDTLTPAIVTGTIFVDTNGNGALNPGEPGLPGVSVVITDGTGVTRTVPVDSNGNYTVTLPPGPFTATVNPATVPPGYVLTTNNSTQNGTATPGMTPTDPVGYQPRGDVTGTVFLDTNGNDTPDPGEGLPGVQVVITDAFGVPVTVTTNASGVYAATGVPSGTATVDVVNSTLPNGVTQTVGIDPSTVPVNPGVVNNAGLDGYRQIGDVTGTVFLDVNGNSVKDGGEGLPNMQVVITDSAGLTQTFLTDPNGLYTFTQVTSGMARVDVINSTLPNGVTQTVGTDPTNVSVLPNQANFEENNGYRQIGAVTGFVYNDVDGNGIYNPLTDVVSSGVTVLITDSAGLTQTTTTLASGFFTFTQVTSGTARVDLVNPPAGTQTQGNDPTNVVVLPNQNNFEQNNGFFNPGSVTGTVFEDTNGNQIQDPGEPGIPNVTVLITDSQGVMRTVTTNANGVYTVTNVPSGTATVDVVNSTLPPGYVDTTLVDPSTVPVLQGQVNDADKDGYQPRADLRISKTDGQSTAVPGALVTYTIVVTNAGPAPVVGARITDTRPAELQNLGWTCVAGAGAACPAPASGSAMDNLSVTLAVNSVLTFTLTGTVNANATGSIINTAVVTTPPGVTDPTPGNNTSTDIDTLTLRADLQIDKGNGVGSVVPGDAMTYTIMVTNAGPSAVTGARITDTLPVTLSNANWVCFAGAGTVCGTTSGFGNIENISVTMQPNSVLTFTVTGTVISTATGFITNTAVVAPPPNVTDPVPGNNTSSDNDPLTPVADLQVVKDDGLTAVTPGLTVTYRITVTNNGPSAVSGAMVSDTLPAMLTNAIWTCASCTPNSGSGNINTNVSLLPGQTVVIVLTATVAANASGNIANTAVVTTPAGVTDPTPGNNTSTDTDTLNPQADLQITKTNGVNGVAPGTLVTYTIVVTNAGPSAVTGARITDTLPASLLNPGWICAASVGATCPSPSSGSTMNNLSVTMAVNSVLTFTLTGTVLQLATGNLVNTVVVEPPPGVSDLTPGNNTATDTDPLTPVADLRIEKNDGLTTATPGLTLTYRITVTNNGPSAVSGAPVSDTLPAALTGASWTCATCTPESGSGNISVTVDLLSGQVAVIVLTGTVAADATGNIANTAVVTTPAGVTDPTPGNNIATDTDNLVPSVDLIVRKSVQPANTVVPGTAITYTVVVSNAGPSKAVNAPLTDTFPVALTNINWTCTAGAGATCGTNSGTTSINGVLLTLDVNSAVTFTVNGIVAADASGNIVNTAVVTVPAGSVDPTPVNNTSTVTNPLTPQALLGIFKTDNQVAAVPGTRITYTVAVTNAGPSAANGVAISDAISAALLSPAWTCAGASGATCNAPTSGNGDISTTVNVPVGGQITFTVVATLSLNASGKLTNTASLTPPPGLTNTNPVTQSTDVDDITPAAITGTIFVDTNGNGTRNPGEPGLPGVSVIITDSLGVTRSVPVDGNGNYTATLPPGPFTATVDPATVQPGYVLTTNNSTQNGTATEGTTTPTQPVGYQPQGTVTGFVYIDYNNSHLFDGNDMPAPGVTVTVLSQGKLVTVTTDASGYFTATGVPSGTATVDLINPPAGVQSQGTDPTGVPVWPNQNNFEENNGFFVTGLITGTVFQDTNGDGDQDPGELGIPNVTVLLTDSLGVTRTVQTDPSGVYTATTVPSGTATVDVVNSTLPPGLRQTAGTDPSSVNVVPSTTQNAGFDGYQPTATVGDRVWEDYNFNGIQDAGEPGIAGVTVNLQTPTGTLQMTTDANGLYTFTNLIPNAVHTMTFIAPAGGYTFTAQKLGGNDATDSDPIPTTGVLTFTLAPAQVNTGLDAGLWRPMTLGNSVWFDANGNGVLDAGEAGVPNVLVQLYRDVNGNFVLDAGDSFVTSATTDAGGLYTFTNQISGTYVVVITSTNFAGSGTLFNYQSSDSFVAGNSDQNNLDHGIVAGSLGATGYVTSVVTLIPGAEPVNDGDTNNTTNLTLDFGFYKLALAGNLVWQDYNNNGLYEPGLGETPIQSATVILLNGAGTQLLVTQTDAGGLYTFTNLLSGTYQVQVVMPANYVNSTYVPAQTLGIDNDDNGVTTTLGSTFSGIFILAPGVLQPVNDPPTASSANNTLDFGLWQPMTLGGQVWNDKNNASGLEGGEPTFAGVGVELYLADVNGLPTGAPVSTTTTSAGGFYTFTNLISGTYVVVVTSTNFASGGVLAGYYNSDGAPVTNNNADNDDDGRPFGAATASGPITLAPGTEPGDNVNTTVDLGFYTLSLGGKAWDDLNNNGRVNAGEPAQTGLTVNLYRDSNGDGTPDGAAISSTTTSAGGLYTFTGLISDTYLVEIIPTGNYTSSTGVVGSPSGPFEPAPDADGDATLDDDNGTRAGGVIRSAPVSLSAGAEPTSDDGDANTNVTIGFGLFQPISIGNQVWNDANNDGLLNNSEAGIGGVTMNLYSGTTLISTTVTSGGGVYTFTYLIPGDYGVELVPPAGFVSSSGSNGDANGLYEPAPSPNNGFDNDDNGTAVSNTVRSQAVTVGVGGGLNGSNSYPTVDFGLMQPAIIGNFVWNDANSNGIQDLGEPGLVGVQVVLYDVGNSPIATTTTGAGGLYTFTKVIPGNYYLVFPQPVGYGRAPADANGNSQDALDSDADVNGRTATFSVTAGQVKSDMDAGYFQYSSIGDRVWNDLSADGIQQAGEPGVTGVTVTLYYNGVPVSSTVTDNTGFYAFVNITPAVPLSVQVSLPAGYLVAPQNVGSDEAIDNDANPQGGSDSVNIVQDSFYRDLDIALWAPLTLGGQVWNDLNNNGQQAGEPLNDGVLVKLYHDSNDNGVFDAGDALVQQTTTSNGGYYTFTNVVQDNYLVVVDASNFVPGGVLAGYKSSDFDDNTNANGDGLDDGRPATGGSIASGVIRLNAGQEPNGILSQENYTVDFGVWLPASLSGVVWLDVDHDGQQDAGESARNGVPVTLHDAATGGVIGTTTTGVINGVPGSYNFGNLIPGSYYVTFPLPADCAPASNAAHANDFSCIWTYPNQGSDTSDSDADTTGQTGNYTLVPGQNENTVGAGYWRPTVLEPGKSTRVIGPVKTGDLITYTLEVRNAGDTLAMGVVITDPLPEGVSFVSASDNGQSTPAGVVWHLPNIPPGQTVSVQVVVQVGNPTGNTLIINIFTASNDGLPGRSVVQDSNQVSTPFAPTAVTLASFYATAEGRGVRVTWQTALERNTFGFNVLRSVTGNRADATQVNAEMVIAAGPNTYSLVDEGGSVGNTYWLEEIELDGDRIDYGPVVAQAVLPGVTQPQPSQPNAPPALQPAPGGGGVNVLGGGVPVAQPAVAQPAQPVAQPQAQPAAQQPAVIPAVPAVIAPETQPQPRPEAQPVAELPQQPIAQSVQPASEPQVQPAAEQPQPPVAQPAPAMPTATAMPVEQVVVGAETGVSVARGGQPAALQLPASTTPAVEPVSETQPVNPLIPAGAGVLALLGLGAAGVFIMRRKRTQ